MVLPNQGSFVAARFRHLIDVFLEESRLRLEIHPNMVSLWPAPGQHGGAAGHTERHGAVVVRKANASFLQAIQRGRCVEREARRLARSIAPLIADQNDDVRRGALWSYPATYAAGSSRLLPSPLVLEIHGRCIVSPWNRRSIGLSRQAWHTHLLHTRHAPPYAVARVAPVEMPPSTSSVCPVIYALASEARNTTAPSRSFGCPGRFNGMRSVMYSTHFWFS